VNEGGDKVKGILSRGAKERKEFTLYREMNEGGEKARNSAGGLLRREIHYIDMKGIETLRRDTQYRGEREREKTLDSAGGHLEHGDEGAREGREVSRRLSREERHPEDRVCVSKHVCASV
jgi:hypothetical protein